MWKPALAMLTGVLAVLALPQLLPGPWLAAALPVAALGLAWKRTRWLVFLPLGFVWCWQMADRNLDARLDKALEGRELTAVGWMHSLPETRGPWWSSNSLGIASRIRTPACRASAGNGMAR